MKLPHLSLLLLTCWSVAGAEQYNLTSKFNSFQPATFRASLNGQPVALHHNADASLNITHLIKPGKNTLSLEWSPGVSSNAYASSTFTLGVGQGSGWHTLYVHAVTATDKAGKVNFVFVGKPDKATKPSAENVVGVLNSFQPVNFELTLNGDTIASMSSDGNTDIGSLLKPGKNVLTLKYTPGKNTNSAAFSTLTVGQKVGKTWNSVLKWGIGATDRKPGSVSFTLYK